MADAGFFGGHRLIDNSTPDAKLMTISTAGKVANSATTATAANTGSAIVTRDGSGNFAAGAITATSFIGNGAALTNLNADNLGSGTVPITRLAGITNSQLDAAAGITDSKLATISTTGKVANSATTATELNTASTIVARDGSGVFSISQITVVNSPTQSNHVATKGYVDTMAVGLDPKASCRAATTANITLSGTQTIDGVAVVVGNRVLVKDQSLPVNNGIYVVAAGSWTRATDADNTSPDTELTAGAFTFIEEGTLNGDSGWVLTTNGVITIGTTTLTFVQFSGAGSITAGAGLIKTGNTFDLNPDNATLEVASDVLQVKALGIGNAHIATGAGIVDTKLATISTTGKVLNSATTAASANTSSAIVARDVNGDFTAGVITATFSGNGASLTALNASVLASGTVPLARIVGLTNAEIASNAAIVDTKLATISTSGKVSNSATTATALNTASAIVARDASGNFAAGTITATFSGNGAGLNTLNASELDSGTVPLARISGLTNAEIAAGAAIADTKLATLSTTGKVANSATTATSANTASAIVARDANGDFNARQVILGQDPSQAMHAATKQYVDALAQSLDIKASCHVATTANINLATGGLLTIDAVVTMAGDRVLVKDQTAPAENGIYLVAAGAWTRAIDADSSADVTSGMFTFVEEGTVNADSGWVLSTNAAITLGATGLTFTQFSGAGQVVAGDGLTKSGNTLSVVVDNSTIEINADALRIKALGVTNSHIATAAGIVDTKLATISTTGKVANSATTATSANTASAIVARDANGDFTARYVSVTAPTADAHAVNRLYLNTKFPGTLLENQLLTGTIDGVNTNFTLAQTPIAGSVKLYLAGFRLTESIHFTVSGNTITYAANIQPIVGEAHRVDYRY